MDNQDKTVQVGQLKVKVIRNLCIGCGTCVALAPKTFELDKDGKSIVKQGSTDTSLAIKCAVDSCAPQAIVIEK